MGMSNRDLLRNLTSNSFQRLRQQAERGPGGANGPSSMQQSLPQASSANRSEPGAEVDWESWVREMADSLGKAMDDWKSMATLTGVQVAGNIGIIKPGDLQGPSLSSLIRGRWMPAGTVDTNIRNAVIDIVSDGWKSWHAQTAGNLEFPTIVAGQEQQTAPAPCVPKPLSSLGSGGSAQLSTGYLKAMLQARCMGQGVPGIEDLMESVASSINTTFQTFKTTTFIVDVQAIGGVATGAPGFLK